MLNATGSSPRASGSKKDADYVFYELTRSICPVCRSAIDAQILIRDNKVYMRKRCPAHGFFEALVYGDAGMYTSSAKFNKPGTIPLQFSTQRDRGCPFDCGLCPDHQQHACLGIIEVNSSCDMDCPLCFAQAGPGFNLTLEEVEDILDHLVATEGNPEVVQFSGGEPSMNLASLDLNLLVALDALLAEGHVGRAANRIGLSQPAASHALQRLREVTGDPLLIRAGACMQLTPRAEEMREPLAKALDQVRSLFVSDRFDPATSTRHFALMMPDHVVDLVMPPLLERIGATAPGIRLDVTP